MATQLATIPKDELSVHFRATYTSASLNEKFKSLPRGYVRGFIPQPTANIDEVGLNVDPLLGESVMNAVGIQSSYIWPVTYRVTGPILLNMAALASGRYYVAMVPNYTTAADTSGEWIAFTEAEFENGDIETAGGVFGFAIDLAGTVLDSWDIWLAGISQGPGQKPFIREDQDNFRAASGPDEKALGIEHLPNVYLTGVQYVSGTLPTFSDTARKSSAGQYSFAASAAVYVGDQIPVWQDENLAPAASATVVVQFWAKTSASILGSVAVDAEFVDALGSTSRPMNEPGRVPTYKTVTVANTSWVFYRYEMKVPIGAPWTIQANTLRVRIESSITSGSVDIGRVQAWVTHQRTTEAGDWSRSLPPANLTSPGVVGTLRIGTQDPTEAPWTVERVAGNLDIAQPALAAAKTVRILGAGEDMTLEVQGDGANSRIFANNAWIESSLGVKLPTLQAQSGDFITVLDDGGGTPAGMIFRYLRSDSTFVEIQNSGGTLGDLQVGEARATVLESDTLKSASSNVVAILSSSDNTNAGPQAQFVRAPAGFVDIQETGGDFGQCRLNRLTATDVGGPNTGIVESTGYVSGTTGVRTGALELVDQGVDVGVHEVSLGVIGGGINTRLLTNYLTLTHWMFAGGASLYNDDGQWGSGITPTVDRLYRGNMPVAHGVVQLRIGTPQFRASAEVFGASGVATAAAAADGRVKVTFANPMAVSTYTVALTPEHLVSSLLFTMMFSKATDGFEFIVVNDANNPINIESTSIDVEFVVFGRQTA